MTVVYANQLFYFVIATFIGIRGVTSSATPAVTTLTKIRLSSFFNKNSSSSALLVRNENITVIKLLWLSSAERPGNNFYDFNQSVGAVNVALERLAADLGERLFSQKSNFSSKFVYDLEIAHAAITLNNGCSASGDMQTIVDIYFDLDYKFDAVIGPPCAEGSLGISTFVESLHRPHILWVGTHPDYDLKTRYPHVVQTATDMGKVMECFLALLHQMSTTAQEEAPTQAPLSAHRLPSTALLHTPWRRLAFVWDSDSYMCSKLIWPTLKLFTEKKVIVETHGIFFSHTASLSGRTSTDAQIRAVLEEVRKTARIVITCTWSVGVRTPFGPPQKYDVFNLRVLAQAYRLGMIRGGGSQNNNAQSSKNDDDDNIKRRREFQWILINTQFSNHLYPPYASLLTTANDFLNENYSGAQTTIDELKLPVSEAELYDIYHTVVTLDQDWGTASDAFSKRVIEAAFQPPWNVNRTEFFQGVAAGRQIGRASVYSPSLADGIYLYGLAVQQALGTGNGDFRSASVMYDIMRNLSFVGESGEFSLTSEGKRLTDVMVYAPVHDYYQRHPLARFELRGVMQCASLSAQEREAKMVGKLVLKTPLEWFGTADGLPPRDTPVCGFNNELCPLLSPREIVAIACAGAVLVVASIVALYYWRRRHLRLAALLNTDWNLQAHDLTWPQSATHVRKYSSSSTASAAAAARSTDGGWDVQIFNGSLGTVDSTTRASLLSVPTTQQNRRQSVASTVRSGATTATIAMAPITALYKNKTRVHVKLLTLRPQAVQRMRLLSYRAAVKRSGVAAVSKSSLSDSGGNGNSGSIITRKKKNTAPPSAAAAASLPMPCLKELRAMKDLSAECENINDFVGILFNVGTIALSVLTKFYSVQLPKKNSASMLLVSAYCSKGSLDNILYGNDGGQQQQPLDWLFKYSFMCDIAAGLAYLHAASALKWHGRLRTRAVLLDARWTCKLADYGLWSFSSSMQEETESSQQEERLLWAAPELLRSPQLLQPESSSAKMMTKVAAADLARQAADVYSFGVILSEIIYQVAPYHNELEIQGKEISEILQILKQQLQQQKTSDFEKKPLLRPEHFDFSPKSTSPTAATTITTHMSHQQYNMMYALKASNNQQQRAAMQAARQLMLDCWQESPTSRPNVKNIVRRLRQLNGRSNNEQSIVDRVIAKLETYAENLEGIVRERTGELLEEQARADALLSRMLPASVARALKHGEPVVPEQYDEATVFFSDVVSFTTIASLATPMQVVELLNDLYTYMDSILDKFEPFVYKVETIGDAYMVVSGIPMRTFNHARIMASMALAILANITRIVRVPHQQQQNFTTATEKPPQSIQLRVGLNSGACVAGVVGLAMPRYCLFGDTVNVASRMESTSEPMRVHISASTRAALAAWPEYACEERGVMDIKGKGEMRTSWLVDGPLLVKY